MAADVTFVHLSDTHFVAEPSQSVLGVTPATNLDQVLAAVEALPLRPDFVLISGDLANNGEPAAYARLRTRLAALEAEGIPILVGLGNHDERVAFRRIWLDEAAASDPEARYYYSHWIGELRVIMLDTLINGAVPGRLDQPQLDWLASQLREPAPGGTLVVMHHPVRARGVRRVADYTLENPDELAAVLASSRDVLGLLTGHLHMPSVALFAGVLTATTPAVIFQFDPSVREGGEHITAGAGFTLGSIRDGHLVVNPIILPGHGAVLRAAR